MTSALRAIYTQNLGIRKTERVLVFNDRPSRSEPPDPEEMPRRLRLRDIAMLTVETGRGISKEVLYTEYPASGAHGTEPPGKLWELAFGSRAVSKLREKKLLGPIIKKKASDEILAEAEKIINAHKVHAVDAVIALSNFSTSHTRFRDLLTRVCGTRYASMPIFDISMFDGPMDVDWRALEKTTRAVARALNTAHAVEIKAPNGTHLKFSKKGRRAKADTGNLKKPGSFGNLPAGEAYLAPLEGTARGTLVLEWAPTRALSSPVTLTVKDGMVTGVSGSEEYAKYLKGKFAERELNANIAELGVGTNPRARRPDNILESEKILGTVHVALGDNSSFGGRVKTPFHQDYLFFRPTLTLIGEDRRRSALIKRGKLKDIL